jgi:hypothetical protein
MNANAANALLKGLEEPPAGAVFLLVSHRRSDGSRPKASTMRRAGSPTRAALRCLRSITRRRQTFSTGSSSSRRR